MFLDYFALALVRIIEVPVPANRPVKKGDVLFKIDPESFEDEIRGLEGELVAARKDRAKELFTKQVASERSLDQTRARVAELQAKLDDAPLQAGTDGRHRAEQRPRHPAHVAPWHDGLAILHGTGHGLRA